METLKQDGILFKGQYADNLKRLLKGYTIVMSDFFNGTWEATSKVQRFIYLLNQTNLNIEINGNSLRSKKIKLNK